MKRVFCVWMLAAAVSAAGTAEAARHAYTRSGVVRIAWATEPVIDPASYALYADHMLGRLLYEPLFDIDRFGRLVPRLAKEVPTVANGGIRDGGRTIRYRLRDDGRFSDGSPVTADDVVRTVRTSSDAGSTYDELASIAADGPRAVVARLKHPSVFFIARFGCEFGPVSYVVKGGVSKQAAASAYVGAGPYVIAEYRRGDVVRLTPNAYYYRGRPAVGEIRLVLLPDPNTRRLEFASHQVDMLVGQVTGDATTASVRAPGVRAQTQPIPGVIDLAYATWKAPFDDARVRRALDLSIDRRVIADRVFLAQVLPATAFTPPGRWLDAPAHAALIAHHDAAARLFEDAGWRRGRDGIREKNGKRLEMTLALQPAFERVAVALQAMFRDAGLDVTLKSSPVNLYYAPADQGGVVKGGKFDAAIVGDLSATDPDLERQFGCPNGRASETNTAQFCDARLVDAATILSQDYDDRRRRAAYDRARAILARTMPVSYLYHPTLFLLVNDDVAGVELDGLGPFAGASTWRV